MEATPAPSGPPVPAIPPRRWSRRKRLAVTIVVLLLVWGGVAYLVLPALWSRYAKRHPSLVDIPGITHTGNGIPGDPLNVALIGTKEDVMKSMVEAGWHPADKMSFDSCLKIAAATVLKRPYEDAPVSNLYLFGRKQDLAFEFPVGNDPSKRHHVRFWKTERDDADGRPVWIGAATYDEKVGLSHRTGQVTHHIAADVDTERDHVFETITKSDALSEKYVEEGFHKVRQGRNGGGDPWHTDGDLWVGVLVAK